MTQHVQGAAELQALAKKFENSGNFEKAAHYYECALGLSPLNAEILYDLAATLHGLQDFDRARILYERAIALQPASAGVYNDLGILYRTQGEFERAFAMFWAAAERDPTSAVIASNLGGSFLERGQLADARTQYQRAADLEPHNGQYLYQLAEVATFMPDDARLDRLLGLLEDEKALGIEDRIGLHFALGKALADARDFSAAFGHFETGNKLKRSRIDYDERIAVEQMNEVVAAFTRPLFDRIRQHGVPDERPIFVVGMPRSGSTLIKQILAMHPSISSTGETPHFSNAVRSASRKMHPRTQHATEYMRELSREDVQEIANTYLANVKRDAGNALRIVDKDLTNFRFVGLVRAVFPNATIIHVRRDALDACWSSYSKLFSEPQPFSYELGELGRYYKAQTIVMDRWREILPDGSFTEIQYEDLIDNFASSCRGLIALCGLPWHTQCLEFHRGQSLVRSSSAVQVRQPLFRDGIGRSRPFLAHLPRLIEALT
ncbi:MAG: sulfotransferase [Rhodospirillaceae bacterium]|nr:sulfotransferase [Rhodospirillaceae bacterium]